MTRRLTLLTIPYLFLVTIRQDKRSHCMLDPLCKFPPPPGAAEPVTAMCVDDTPAGEVIYAGFANGHIRVYRASIQVVTMNGSPWS
jgi:hypothetical protein